MTKRDDDTVRLVNDTYNLLARRIADLEAQNAKLLSLVREVIDDPPVKGGRHAMPPNCAFCGAVYDNPHTKECWIIRAEKAVDAKGDIE